MATAVAPVPALRTYAIDASHSEVTFQVRHMLSKVRGRFRAFEGTFDWDAAHPESSAVGVRIQAASVDTGQPDRDAHLRSDDFFASATFPELTFVSEHVTPAGPDQFDVSGMLTIRGIARPIVLPVTYLGAAVDPWGNERLHFEAETTINRKDYGLNWNAVLESGGFLVGDDVKIAIQVQAIAAKSSGDHG